MTNRHYPLRSDVLVELSEEKILEVDEQPDFDHVLLIGIEAETLFGPYNPQLG